MLPEMRGGVLNESNYSQVGKSLRQRVFKLKIVLGSKGLILADLFQHVELKSILDKHFKFQNIWL